MKKGWRTAALLLSVLGILTACGVKDITIADLKDTEVEKYITLPDYKNLEVTKPQKVEITDEYVKSYLSNRINMVSAMHELTGTVENGDVVNIDYAGTIDGTAFQGGTAQGQLLEIGSGAFIAGFEDGLIGASVGDRRELNLQFPEDYKGNTELAGKDCVFAVTINYILAELTDENVELVEEGYQSARAYRDDVKAMLTSYAEYQYERELENYIATALVAECTYKEVPSSLADDYKNSLQAEFERTAETAGQTFEEYMANTYYLAADSLEEEMTAIALRCAKEGLAIQAIANVEGFSVTEEEVDAAIAGYAEAGSAEGDLNRDPVRVNLLYEKVYDFLKDYYRE